MKKFSNTYIFAYITGLVLVVAVLLSLVAIRLKPLQERNRKVEQEQQILAAAGYTQIPQKEMVQWFADHVRLQEVPGGDQPLPLYALYDRDTVYVLPVAGKGLWGAIWGYVAIASDGSTVVGTAFSHKSETPGLGGEITTPKFQSQFRGKRLFDAQRGFVSIAVLKGGGARNDHQVDAISGATITSKGVDNMLRESLKAYVPFLQSLQPTPESQIPKM